jgi:hypothetical protein
MNEYRVVPSLLLMTALLVAGTTAAAATRDFQVVDQRTSPARGEVRNSAGGVEVTLPDRAHGRSLVDQLADRLSLAQGFENQVQRLVVSDARITMFIDGATATLATASLEPGIRALAELNQQDQLYQFRVHSRLAERRFIVTLAGEADGRPFVTQKAVVFRDGAQETRSRKRVTNLALDDAVAQILGQPR